MGTLRILLRNNYWASGALLLALLLWVGGGPVVSTSDWSTAALNETEANPASDADNRTGDQEDDRPVLSSLEAVVAPVAKLQVFFLGGLVPPRVVHETIEPLRVAPLTPQNNYLRTLFRLITPANAP